MNRKPTQGKFHSSFHYAGWVATIYLDEMERDYYAVVFRKNHCQNDTLGMFSNANVGEVVQSCITAIDEANQPVVE